MEARTVCPECGTEVSAGLAEGLCPRCLLALAIRCGPGSGSDAMAADLTEEQPERYALIGEYARGGMGRVLHVRDRVLGREIAMKELAEHAVSDSRALQDELTVRFLREARITGRLEHPSITPVHELGRREDGSVYYTMKLVRGRTLAQAIGQCAGLPERLALVPHLVAVCNAIAYAHSLGIIHRDIKPENVVLGDFGETVVLDWGIAKVRDDAELWSQDLAGLDFLLSSDQGKTLPGFVLGTPAFMPPEQARGRNKDVDERSDVYALGASLYFVLTGRQPFEGESGTDILMQVLREEPRPIRSLELRAPKELVAICGRAMEKTPALRFQSAKELANELSRFIAKEPVRSYRYNAAERALRVVNRYRGIAVTAMAAFVAVAAVLTVYTLRLRETNARLEQARAAEFSQRERAEGTNEELRWENYAALLQVAQSQVQNGRLHEAEATLYRCPADLRDWEWGYLLSLIRSSALVNVSGNASTKHLGSTFASALSPDDRYLLIDRPGTAIRTLTDLTTGEIAWQTPAFDGWRDCTAFSMDGSLLALGTSVNQIGLFEVPSGQPVQSFSVPGFELRSCVLSKSNRWIAALALGADWERRVVVFDVKSGEAIYNVATPQPNEGPPVRDGEKGWWIARFDPPPGSVLAFSQDESTLHYNAGGIMALSLGDGTTALVVETNSYAAAATPDGTRLIVHQGNGRWDLWNLPERRIERSYAIDVSGIQGDTAHLYASNDFVLTNDAGAVIVADPMRRRYVYFDLAEGRAMFTSDLLPETMVRMSASPSGRFLTTTGLTETNIWRLQTPRKASYYPFRAGEKRVSVLFPQANGVILSPRYSPDGRSLATPDDAGNLFVWRTSDYTLAFESSVYGAEVRTIVFDAGERIAAGAVNGSVVIHDRWSGTVLAQRHFTDGGKISALGFTPDGRGIAVAHEYTRETVESGFAVSHVGLYDAATLEFIEPIWTAEYDQTVNHIRFTDSGRLILGVDTLFHIGSEFQVVDARTHEPLAVVGDVSFTGHIDVNADDTLALLSTSGSDVVLFNLHNLKEVWRTSGLNAHFATFHPGGKRFYAFSGNGFGIIASLADARELVQVEGGGPRAAFSTDGATLYTVPGQPAWFHADYGRAIEAYPSRIANHAELEAYQREEFAGILSKSD